MDLQILNGIEGADPEPAFDFADMGGGGAGLGETITDPVLYKQTQRYEAAKANGDIPAHYTLEQYLEWARQRFIATTGKTPEQFTADAKAEIAAAQQAGAQTLADETAKLKAELDKRGVAYPRGATKEQLLALLRDNPTRSPLSNIANTVNKVNPGAVALRTGILLGMKMNTFNLGEKLRWGFYPSLTVAKKAGFQGGTADFDKVRKAAKKLTDIFHGAGGKAANLKKAILEGKGNKDRRVALHGLGEAPSVRDILGPEIHDDEVRPYEAGGAPTLGVEPITATAALAAAAGVLGTVAAIVGDVKTIVGGESPQPLPGTEPDFRAGYTDPATGEFVEAEVGPAFREEDGTEGDGGDDPEKKGGFIQWVKDNPLLAAGIGVGICGLGYAAYRAATSGTKAKKGLSGLGDTDPKPKAKAKTKAKPKPKKKVEDEHEPFRPTAEKRKPLKPTLVGNRYVPLKPTRRPKEFRKDAGRKQLKPAL